MVTCKAAAVTGDPGGCEAKLALQHPLPLPVSLVRTLERDTGVFTIRSSNWSSILSTDPAHLELSCLVWAQISMQNPSVRFPVSSFCIVIFMVLSHLETSFLFAGLGMEPTASHVVGKSPTTEPLSLL